MPLIGHGYIAGFLMAVDVHKQIMAPSSRPFEIAYLTEVAFIRLTQCSNSGSPSLDLLPPMSAAYHRVNHIMMGLDWKLSLRGLIYG